MKKILQFNKQVYIVLVSALTLILLLALIPCLKNYFSFITPAIALFSGLVFAQIFGSTYQSFNSKMSKYLLQYSVVGLGFGMNLTQSLQSGKEGMLFTVASVFGTLLLGWIIGRKLLKVDNHTSYLISSGTAICGGSAIAAVGPIIKAKPANMSIALGTIFILNAVALFIFPPIGHIFSLTDKQFGTWAAIAIHDTSSVVGAGAAYSQKALEIATTVKLTRALWIVPVAILTSFLFKNKEHKIRIPLFIIFFICAILINTYAFKSIPQVGTNISLVAKQFLTLSLFFIGASLTRQTLKQVGFKPFMQGVILWILISCISFAFVMSTIE